MCNLDWVKSNFSTHVVKKKGLSSPNCFIGVIIESVIRDTGLNWLDSLHKYSLGSV